MQLQLFPPELSISLLQSNASELDKTSDYISVSVNVRNLFSLITPINQKGESNFYTLYFYFSSMNAWIEAVEQLCFQEKLLAPNRS